MAYVDLESGRIVDVKKGSLSYLHEEGHIKFSKTDKAIINSFRQSFYFYLAVTMVIFGQFSWIVLFSSVVFIFIFWYYYLYEETWCWVYAIKKRKELKGGKGKYGLEKKEKERT